MMVTLVRCHCCGEWQLVYNWNNKKPTYCESCSIETDASYRSGPGRGQCAYCKLYPQNLQHWNDPMRDLLMNRFTPMEHSNWPT